MGTMRELRTAAERAARVDLAAAFRLAVRLDLHEGVCNHFSVMLAEGQRFLLNRYGVHWSEVTASNLLALDAKGDILEGEGEFEKTAFYIHSRIHLAHPRAACVLHTHMPYATALTLLEGGRLEGRGDRFPDRDCAVAGEEHPPLRAERAREAVAFRRVDHQAVVDVVVGDVVEEAKRILLRHLEPAAFEQRKRRGEGHVRVQHARRAWMGEMDARVDVEGGLLELALAFQDVALGVQRQKIGRRHLAPVQTVAIQQESLPFGQHHAEVIADPLVQLEAHRQPERRGELDSHRALGRRSAFQLAHGPHARAL